MVTKNASKTQTITPIAVLQVNKNLHNQEISSGLFIQRK